MFVLAHVTLVPHFVEVYEIIFFYMALYLLEERDL